MFHIIEGLPADVFGVEGSGKITHADYRDVLIPRAEAMMGEGAAKTPIKMLYVLDADFSGYELEALWDDTRFGGKHWRNFSRIALVTDVGWIRVGVSLFMPFFPCDVKLFPLAEVDTAKAWIVT